MNSTAPENKFIRTTTPFFIRAWRLARILLHLGRGVLTTALILPRAAAGRRDQLIRRWSADLLAILNIRVMVHGQTPAQDARRVLLVANHVSWLDIWAIRYAHHVTFVAKSEVREWPIVGWLAQKTGTLFIERERRHTTGRTLSELERELLADQSLCLFPEGTTTDGRELRPFKTGLLQSAINTGATVWPLAIRYPGADGGINTAVAYHGDITMAASLWQVLKQREIMVELHFAAPVPARDQERRHLSRQARHAIASLLHLPAHTAPETHADPPDAVR